MAGAGRARVLVAARTQLRKIADEVLETTFDTLESRVIRARSAKAGLDGGRQIGRTREVLERDRALASCAAPAALPIAAAVAPAIAPIAPAAVAVPLPAPPPPAVVPPAVVCDEPIRTRTMAQLLAAQGHPDRALSIYRYLLARDPGNASLHAEIPALEAAIAQQASQG